MDWNLIITSLFVLAFGISAARYGTLQWLWCAVIVWLVAGLFSAHILPRVMGITHLSNVYLAHGYIFIGSIFFWLNSVRKLPDSDTGKAQYIGTAGILLTLLAQASLVMHAAFILLVLIVWQAFPNGFSLYAASALGYLYGSAWIWWTFTAVIIDIFWLHRSVINRQSAAQFNWQQLSAGLLLALLMQAAFVYASLHAIFEPFFNR